MVQEARAQAGMARRARPSRGRRGDDGATPPRLRRLSVSVAGLRAGAWVLIGPLLVATGLGEAGAGTLAAGARHVCAVDDAGAVTCWGDNAAGQLGLAAWGSRPGPVGLVVPDVGDAVAIAAAESGTCALLRDGAIRCWGALSDPPPWGPASALTVGAPMDMATARRRRR